LSTGFAVAFDGMHTPVAAECAWADADAGKRKEEDNGTAETKSDGPNERSRLSSGDSARHTKVEDLEEEFVARGPFLTFFAVLNCAAAGSALLLSVAHAAALWAQIQHPFASAGDCVYTAMRFYELCFCVGVAAVELEVAGVEASWILKGFAYVFVGLLALASTTDGDNRPRAPAAWRHDRLIPYDAFLEAAAGAMMAVGAVYVALGVCCCRKFARNRGLEYRKALARAELRNAFFAELATRGDEMTANPV